MFAAEESYPLFASVFPEGYLARSIPGEEPSPYLRLVLEVESRTGCERLEIAFPTGEDSEKALERILPLLQVFAPRQCQGDGGDAVSLALTPGCRAAQRPKAEQSGWDRPVSSQAAPGRPPRGNAAPQQSSLAG